MYLLHPRAATKCCLPPLLNSACNLPCISRARPRAATKRCLPPPQLCMQSPVYLPHPRAATKRCLPSLLRSHLITSLSQRTEHTHTRAHARTQTALFISSPCSSPLLTPYLFPMQSPSLSRRIFHPQTGDKMAIDCDTNTVAPKTLTLVSSEQVTSTSANNLRRTSNLLPPAPLPLPRVTAAASLPLSPPLTSSYF